MTSATFATGSRLRATAFTALAACAAIGAVASAHAAAGDPLAVKVRYSDLNLSTEQGSLVLYGRIVAAANEVCAVDDLRNLSAVSLARACTEQAIARAVREVNNPTLASVYAAQRARHG